MFLPDARRLWIMQLRLECKALDGAGERVVRIEGSRPDEIATCSVARFQDGFRVTFDVSADDALVERAAGLPGAMFFEDSVRTARVIGGGRPMRITRCSTYAFPPVSMSPEPGVVRNGHEEYVRIAGDREVSWASSVRTNSEAAELWVRTADDARRRGYGRQVSTAWASEVTGEGRVAFYSHLEDNLPSRRLAARLGVAHLFDLATFTFEA